MELWCVSFTFRNAGWNGLGRLSVDQKRYVKVLQTLKNRLAADELMHLSTCNRVEFYFSPPRGSAPLTNHSDLAAFILSSVYPFLKVKEVRKLARGARICKGEGATNHLFRVASSLDSLVVGEREILTQLRDAYAVANGYGLTGEALRIAVHKAVETAKRVYSQTAIAHKPVSVASLACRKLRASGLQPDSRILIVGAGSTATAVARYLKKHGCHRFTIANRSPAAAGNLAAELGGETLSYRELSHYTKGFDVLITCTSSGKYLITPDLYECLHNGDAGRKTLLDLSLPANIDPSLQRRFSVRLLTIRDLKSEAGQNLRARHGELEKCEQIIREQLINYRRACLERQVALALREVPLKVQSIRHKALSEVFEREVASLDEPSRKVLDRVLDYMEKKYIAVPMKMAREALVGK